MFLPRLACSDCIAKFELIHCAASSRKHSAASDIRVSFGYAVCSAVTLETRGIPLSASSRCCARGSECSLEIKVQAVNKVFILPGLYIRVFVLWRNLPSMSDSRARREKRPICLSFGSKGHPPTGNCAHKHPPKSALITPTTG